jgi:putative hydrolase of the HAD superfamily
VLAPLRRVFTSHELGLRKPDPAIFRRVAEIIGVPAARIRFLDDAPANVEAAAATGMTVTHVDAPARTAAWLREALGAGSPLAGTAGSP